MRLGVACAIMAAFAGYCALNYDLLRQIFHRKEFAILAVAVGAFAIYAIAALALRAISISEIRGALRREKGPPAPEGGLPPGLDG